MRRTRHCIVINSIVVTVTKKEWERQLKMAKQKTDEGKYRTRDGKSFSVFDGDKHVGCIAFMEE